MKIGIIGGSGLDDPKLLQDYYEKEVETKYGKPSSALTCGKINGVDVCILARHGKKHEITPTHVNNRANIKALIQEGCTHIIATTAVGSLREKIDRGHFVILSDFIDFTKHRHTTFFQKFKEGEMNHTPMTDPFSPELQNKAIKACENLNLNFHKEGTVITIEGPRFSTRAESHMFRGWNADVINMSTAPEAILAKEARINYMAIAMSTDYDCWKENEEPVSWESVITVFKQNADNMKNLLVEIIKEMTKNDLELIKNKIRTITNWPKPGIMFRDITTLIQDPEGFGKTIDLLEKRYKDEEIDIIAGIEARGFIFGAALADRLKKGLVIIRKPGKLPCETESQEYKLEYGTDKIEIHKDAISAGQKVLLIDDLIATGGTCLAAAKLVKKLGGEIFECSFVIDLPEVGGRKKLEDAGLKTFSLVEFEGE